LAKQGLQVEAIDHYHQSLAIRPNEADAHVALARVGGPRKKNGSGTALSQSAAAVKITEGNPAGAVIADGEELMSGRPIGWTKLFK
jgi:hypothetical protein